MGLLACFTTGLLGCLLAGPLMGGVHAEECPLNWLAYRSHCYGYFAQELTWQQAETQCRSSGGHLASILDVREHQAIAQYLQRAQRWDDEDVWFGLSFRGQSREWSWADDSPVRYTAWEKYKSSLGLEGEHCAALEESSGFMLWDNDSCYDKNPFVCKV
ncbi:dromaiocalcin-1-like [Hemicordylus capensis]|uniref:dromaiocalcin-1-like n=1 Tax=Hemicordylus capensis TaxID=884348 RepID=UPI00230415DE|nr:dromaiocalcin-1-like [Hemicordylus capensis]